MKWRSASRRGAFETDGLARRRTQDPALAESLRPGGFNDVSLGAKWHLQESDEERGTPGLVWLLHLDVDSGSSGFHGQVISSSSAMSSWRRDANSRLDLDSRIPISGTPMTKTFLQLAREIATLQASAAKQLAAEKKAAVADINEVIATYDLAAADLKFSGPGPSAASPGSKVRSTSTSAVSGAKYADGKGNTWGGRGPRPAWLRNAMSAGKSLDSFFVSAENAAVPARDPALRSGSAVRSPRKAGFTVAPKYRHPGSGDTWSGRGSAPRWLKEALRKRGTKLDDFLIAKPAATASSDRPAKAVKSVAASKRKVVASTPSLPKPVVSAKVASVKAPAGKKAVASKSPTKNAIAASRVKKAAAKKSTAALSLSPAVPPKKKPAAPKQAVVASQRVATKAKAASVNPARKAVAAKKRSAPPSAAAVGTDVPAEAASGVSSSASETPASSSVV